MFDDAGNASSFRKAKLGEKAEKGDFEQFLANSACSTVLIARDFNYGPILRNIYRALLKVRLIPEGRQHLRSETENEGHLSLFIFLL